MLFWVSHMHVFYILYLHMFDMERRSRNTIIIIINQNYYVKHFLQERRNRRRRRRIRNTSDDRFMFACLLMSFSFITN